MRSAKTNYEVRNTTNECYFVGILLNFYNKTCTGRHLIMALNIISRIEMFVSFFSEL